MRFVIFVCYLIFKKWSIFFTKIKSKQHNSRLWQFIQKAGVQAFHTNRRKTQKYRHCVEVEYCKKWLGLRLNS